jgi:L-aminopeptidase/D-esterase-like protein
VVAETYDGRHNAIDGLHVTEADALAALDGACDPVYLPAVQCSEEAVINAMLSAEDRPEILPPSHGQAPIRNRHRRCQGVEVALR